MSHSDEQENKKVPLNLLMLNYIFRDQSMRTDLTLCVHLTCQSKYNRKKTTEYNQFSNLAQHTRTPVCMHSKWKNTTKSDKKIKEIKNTSNLVKTYLKSQRRF